MFVAYDVWFIKTPPYYNVRCVHFCMFQKNQEHNVRLILNHRDTEVTENSRKSCFCSSMSLWLILSRTTCSLRSGSDPSHPRRDLLFDNMLIAAREQNGFESSRLYILLYTQMRVI